MSEFSLILVLQKENKQNSNMTWKGTNKIWKTHTFWRNFFNHGAIWLPASTYYRPDTWSEMQQYHRISVQRNYSFSDERILLWRFMRGGCNITTDAPSLVSSYPSYMQLWYHPQSHQGTDTGKHLLYFRLSFRSSSIFLLPSSNASISCHS